jgi:hypothetical protein
MSVPLANTRTLAALPEYSKKLVPLLSLNVRLYGLARVVMSVIPVI